MLEETTSLIAELRTLIGELGKDGGLISPSVYDTAQVLRYYPPKEGVEPALHWLIVSATAGWRLGGSGVSVDTRCADLGGDLSNLGPL